MPTFRRSLPPQSSSQIPLTSEHRASIKQRHRPLLPIIAFSPKSLPRFQLPPPHFFPISFSVFLFYILLGGSKSKSVPLWQRNPFSVCANHFHLHSLIFSATEFPLTSLHISSFEITLGRKISKPIVRHLLRFLG